MKVYTIKNNGVLYTEEVPTNSVGSGAIAGLPPDEPPMRKKKKKFRTDIFQRIKNARLKEETMEDQQIVTEADQNNSNSEVSAAMRMIQNKRKLNKKQEREKRARDRKQEITAISKAKAKDYARKASDRQKKVAADVAKASERKVEKNSFDWQGAFTALNEQFASLSEEQQEKFLFAWMELSEENQDKFTDMISENFDRASEFVENL